MYVSLWSFVPHGAVEATQRLSLSMKSWLMMDLRTSEHPDEDNLEQYLMGSLDHDEAKQIEEHLLMCQICRENPGELELYIKAMQTALASSTLKSLLSEPTT